MTIDTIKYLILDATKSLKRNITLTIGTIITISTIFFIGGLFLLYIMSLNKNAATIFINNKAFAIIFKYVEVVALILLPLASLLIITNVFKIVVSARDHEISIMKSIGATDWFILWPFIIQGLIIGVIGAITANISLLCAYSLIYSNAMNFLLDLSFVQPTFIVKNMLLQFILSGAIIGPIGSILALRKILNVK
ncbi:MAG: FtsX-like permease family protein [Clostridium sp.]